MDSACDLNEGRKERGREGGRTEGRKEERNKGGTGRSAQRDEAGRNRDEQERKRKNRGTLGTAEQSINPVDLASLPAWTFHNNILVSLQ
jgi:hypothetical protein